MSLSVSGMDTAPKEIIIYTPLLKNKDAEFTKSQWEKLPLYCKMHKLSTISNYGYKCSSAVYWACASYYLHALCEFRPPMTPAVHCTHNRLSTHSYCSSCSNNYIYGSHIMQTSRVLYITLQSKTNVANQECNFNSREEVNGGSTGIIDGGERILTKLINIFLALCTPNNCYWNILRA